MFKLSRFVKAATICHPIDCNVRKSQPGAFLTSAQAQHSNSANVQTESNVCPKKKFNACFNLLLSQSPEPWSLQTEKEPLVMSQMSEISRPWSQDVTSIFPIFPRSAESLELHILHCSFVWCEVLRQQRGQPH